MEKNKNRFNAQLAQAVANIELETMSEVELLNFKLEQKAEILNAWAGEDLQRQQIARQQIEALETQHQAKMFEIELAKNMAVRNMQIGTWQLGAELLQQFAGKSKAAALAVIAINKGLAIAQVIQNTQVAIMRGYAELGPYAGTAFAASMKTLQAIQIGLITATGLAQGANVGGGGASLGSPANPISTTGSFGSGSPSFVDTSNRAVSQTVINLNVTGVVTRELITEMIEKLRDEVGNNEAIIIPQNSRQALELTT